MERLPPDKVWTYDDLAALPEDGKRYEIHDGVLVVSPSPSTKHQLVLGNLYALLRTALHSARRAVVLVAPFDVVMSPTRVTQPDIIAIAQQRRAEVLRDRGAHGAPDLAIEILSPGTEKHDRVTKRRMYARAGIREYWIVDPVLDTVEVLELIDSGLSYRSAGFYASGERVKSVVFPLEIGVDQIFADPFAS